MKSIIYLLLAAGLLTTACSTTRITTSWRADAAIPQHYNRVMVLGLIRDKDRSLQEKMEMHLVGDLKHAGIFAVSSLQEYGPKAFDNMDEEKAIEKIKGDNIDAVVTIVLLDKQKERRYVPGNIYYTPFGFYYNRFWGYRGVLYNRIYEPGYYTTETKYFWESNLYDMHTQKLVYSVQTQSFDPASSENMAHAFGRVIVQSMIRNNVLKTANGSIVGN